MSTPRKNLRLSGILLVVLLALSGPVASWLQAPRSHLTPQQPFDALYLVCGARAQHRRLDATIDAWRARDPALPLLLLVGNDDENSLWSRREQRNLTRAEWAVKHLSAAMGETEDDIRIVPGSFRGTDGEMAALAAFLVGRTGRHRMALVTCPFHARRVLLRLRHHAGPGLEIRLWPVPAVAADRYPWRVLGECIKILRDAAGLSRTPGLSRPAHPNASHRTAKHANQESPM